MKKLVNGELMEMTPEEVAELEASRVRPVPEMVTMFQARAALMQAGLFDAVDAYCKAHGGVTLQAWEYANNAYRHGALITSLAPVFNLTSDQVDDLFRTADRIEA